MLTTALFAAALFAPQGPNAPVVINEFQYDDSSTDDREYVEIYNATGAPIDISGWVLGGRDQVGPNPAYTVPSGTILAAGDYYVFGSALVPNVDQVVGTTNLWENDMESIELYDAGSVLIDSVVYEANKNLFPTAGFIEGEGVWGNMQSNDFFITSWSRMTDGYDTGNNGDDFRLMPGTPGTSNNLPTIERTQDTFDALVNGTQVPGWGASFAFGFAIDPTVADTNNPNAIPASPQGGNAAIFWDRSGGGNANMYLADGSTDSHIEAWVYMDASAPPSGGYEMWSFGIGGGDTFHNFPDPAGTLGFNANGNTGIAWVYWRDVAGANLYLVDYNDGGSGASAVSQPVVLGSIPIVAGTNDGWQRLSLTVSGTAASGRFGGSYGAADGTLISGVVAAAIRGVHIGYREILANNLECRPFTCDNLLVAQCGPASTQTIGNGVMTSAATVPAIGISGAPQIGSANSVLATGLLPASPAYLFIGVERLAPITLGALAPPGFALWVDAIATPSTVTDGVGAASIPQGIPADPQFCGIELGYQWVQIDAGLSYAVPIVHSDALVAHIGL